MRVFLDDQAIVPDRPSLGGALSAGRAAAERAGRVIVEVIADGRPLTEQELGSQDTARMNEIRLVSAEPRSLVRVTLQEVADLLPMCEKDQQDAADLIQSGRVQEALPKLSGALSAWDNVRSAVENGAALVGLELATLRLSIDDGEEEAIAESIASLAKELEEIKRCLRVQDWSGLSDSLSMEMQDQARRWRSVLVALADRVGGRVPGERETRA